MISAIAIKQYIDEQMEIQEFERFLIQLDEYAERIQNPAFSKMVDLLDRIPDIDTYIGLLESVMNGLITPMFNAQREIVFTKGPNYGKEPTP